MEKQKKLENFLKKLNSGKQKNKILFSRSVIREAGYYTNNNSYKKINYKINNKEKKQIYSYCHTDYGKDNINNKKYDIDVCFLKHIDFSKNNESNNSYFKNVNNK